MILWLVEQANDIHKDSFLRSMINWLIIGFSTVYCGIKWCQEKNPNVQSFKEYKQEVKGTKNQAYTKCWKNWEFLSWDNKITENPLPENSKEIGLCKKMYFHQKNINKHNLVVQCKSTPEDPLYYSNCNCIRILQQHHQLGMKVNKPLVIYKRNKGSKRWLFFLKAHVEKKFNKTDKACYSKGYKQYKINTHSTYNVIPTNGETISLTPLLQQAYTQMLLPS